MERLQVGPIIGAERPVTGRGELLPVVNPADGQVIADEMTCDSTQVDQAVDSSATAFHSSQWRGLAAADRGHLLLRLADRIEENSATLVERELLDTGKPIAQLRTGEIPLVAAILRFYAGAADKMEGTVKAGPPGQTLLHVYEPHGVVAGILPWNYPLVNAALKVAPAVAAGNAIVLKPSAETPLSTVAFAQLCLQAGFPPGLVNVVLGSGPTVGSRLIAHRLLKKVSFTGSTQVGSTIQKLAADTMTRVNLECGGKNAILVFADADLERAAEATLISAFLNAGQLCVSCSRLLVEESAADRFEAILQAKLARLKVGDPRAEDTQVGPMITRSQYDTVLRYLATAADDGCTVLCGGGRPDLGSALAGGFWIEPTILTGVRPTMRVHTEEIFGPVLSVLRFRDEEEAVAISNGVEYGLSGSVWTRDLSRGFRLSAALDTGIIWVNTMLAGYPQISVPPHKMSGTGVELGMEGLLAYMQRKSIVIGHDDHAAVGWSLS